jgi:ABC-type polysaccharide/polyol phosphate export permease
MFEPVFHYLIESVRVCAHGTDLSVNELVVWLLALVSLFAGLVVLRLRVRR